MKMQNITAVVTGASRGIGKAIAKGISAEGGRVALVARSGDELKSTQQEILNRGGDACVFVTDLRNEDAINELLSNVHRELGEVGIVVNVAGVWHGIVENEDKPYADKHLELTPPEQISEVLDVGIKAPMLLTRLFLPDMIKMKRGKVLNISGTFFNGASGWLHYYVSKKAIESFTKGLAEELQEYMIQVNCISPSDVATEPYRKHFPQYAGNALTPDDVSKFAVFLLSEDADDISGQIILLRNRTDSTHYIFAQ